MNTQKIDLSEMNLLEMPERGNRRKEVRVNEKGEIMLSAYLRQKIFDKEERHFIKYYYTDDYRTIALQASDDEGLKFPKSGKLKYQAYANKLEVLGYKLPVKYRVEWNEEIQAWVGTLQEVSPVQIFNTKRQNNNPKNK